MFKVIALTTTTSHFFWMIFFHYTSIFFLASLFFLIDESASSSTLNPPAPFLYTVKVVNTFPHERQSFTQGLVYHKGFIYEGTGLKGASYLMKKDLSTGKSVKTLKLPDIFFGEGITVIKNRVIQLTWKSGKGFVYDLKTFKVLHEFYYPTEGWGLTNNGSELIMSDGSPVLSFLSPENFKKIKEVYVKEPNGTPVQNINELEYINGFIYANIWQTDKIAIISPENGIVTGWIDLNGILPKTLLTYPVDVLNGIAYDREGDRLFVTGKLWPLLFEIKVVEKARKTSFN